MIRIVIVEDEDMVVRRLTRFIDVLWVEQNYRVDAFGDFHEANDHLIRVGCDLLFLDLNLSGMDGFQLIRGTRLCGFATIVVSANTDRAAQAFDLGVLDFVAKPFSQERLGLALSRFKAQQTRTLNRYLASKSTDGLKLTPLEEIVAIHGAGNYCEVETEAGERILHDRNLEQLNSFFLHLSLRLLVPSSSSCLANVVVKPNSIIGFLCRGFINGIPGLRA